MKIFGWLRAAATGLFHRSQVESEMEEELRAHIAHRADDLERSGLARVEAERRAKIEFGGYQKYREESREAMGAQFLETLFQDVRFGLRMLRKSAGFTAVAVLTLALGIGANTAVFSVIHGLLLQPLPYPDADRIGKVWVHFSPQNLRRGPLSVADYFDWRTRNHVFEDPSAFSNRLFDLTGISKPEQVMGARVTAGFFSTMRVAPLIGRTFLPGEDSGASPNLAVIGESLWRRQFGAKNSVVGRPIEIDGVKSTIIGVMPKSFRFPAEGAGLWTNLRLEPPTRRGPFFLTGLGRLRPGVTWKQAQAETNGIGRTLEAVTNGSYRNASMPVLPIREALVGDIRLPLLVILGAVIAVLLIACANVANLLLARSTVRQHEMALRVALGAGPQRLVQQLLTESLTLAFAGAAAGVVLAWYGVAALRAWNPGNLPRISEVRLNAPVLVFTVLVAVASGVLFGLAPARHSVHSDPINPLKEGGRAARGHGQGTRALLAIAEIALSFMLLIAGGLLLRSFRRLEGTDSGIRAPLRNVLTMLVSPSPIRYKDSKSQTVLYDRILEWVSRLPGVESAAFSDSRPPTYWSNSDTFHILGQPWSQEAFPSSPLPTVSPAYFRLLGIPLVRGRYFDEHDVGSAAQVAVISAALARRYFPAQDPIGQQIAPSDPELNNPPYQIVGVVGDVKYSGLQSGVESVWYKALAQGPGLPMFLLVRSPRPAAQLRPAVENAIHAVNKDIIIASQMTLEDVVGNSVAQPRFRTALLTLFAAIALVLASAGTYGVIAYSVAQRTSEIGIRIALGAQDSDVLKMILVQGAKLGLAGVALGVTGAFAVGRVLPSLLFATSSTDPLTFAAVTVLLLSTTLLACWMPARRAMKVDPMVALRYE